jgi:hypothetical protein
LATQAEINQIDSAITSIANAYADAFQPAWNEFLIAWSRLPDPYDRVAVFGLLSTLTEVLGDAVDGVDVIGTAMLKINKSDVNINSDVADLKSIMYSQNIIALEDETNTLMAMLLGAGIAGAATVLLTNRNNQSILKRIKKTFDQTVIQLSSQITRILGTRDPSATYKYVGGIITTTRPFCARHTDAVYTLKEIDSIWASSWEGKAPGDAFAVRGGYNCRHFWILEK